MATEFEREIDEILKKMGDQPPPESPAQRLVRGLRARWDGFWGAVRALPQGADPGHLMITAILFIITAWILRYIYAPATPWVGAAGLAMFVAAYFLSFRGLFRGRRRQVRWRGQIVELNASKPSPADRLLLWIRRKFRGY